MKPTTNISSFAYEVGLVLVLAALGIATAPQAPQDPNSEVRAGRAALRSTLATAHDLGAASLVRAVEEQPGRAHHQETAEARAESSSI
jgi:hypothetical protein